MKLITTLAIGAAILAVGSLKAEDAQANFNKLCAPCHGKDGSGDTKMGKKVGVKDYRDPKVQAELTDEKAMKQIKEGLTENGKERMKPFKDKLTDDEIKALIAYIRTFKK